MGNKVLVDEVIATVLKVAEYIEENPEASCLEDIAKNVYISRFHLDRIFRAATGKGLMEYVRGRRLSASLHDLADTTMRISDVAIRHGYNYETSFIRAFQKEYGISPTCFRKQKPAVFITDRLYKSSLEILGNGVLFKPSHVFKPAFTIGGIKAKMCGDEIRNKQGAANLARDFFFHHSQRIVSPVNPSVYIGFSCWKEFQSENCEYMAATEINKDSVLPDDMTMLEIPASSYAVFRYTGLFGIEHLSNEHIRQLWSFIGQNWLPERQMTWKDVASFEYVDASLSCEDYCELDLYVQIKE